MPFHERGDIEFRPDIPESTPNQQDRIKAKSAADDLNRLHGISVAFNKYHREGAIDPADERIAQFAALQMLEVMERMMMEHLQNGSLDNIQLTVNNNDD